MQVNFSGIKGTAASAEDYSIYKKRILSACIIRYDTRFLNGELIHAPGWCVSDLQDGEYVNFFIDKEEV